MKLCIVALRYLEPSYQKTIECISKLKGIPVFFADRDGVGPMSVAFNRCIKEYKIYENFDFAWLITNIEFTPDIPEKLLNAIDDDYAAVCPSYDSDHHFLRGGPQREIPYIEFTCPLIRTSVLAKFPLNENMPYYYFDLEFSYRVRKDGHKFGAISSRIEHTYLRNEKNNNSISIERSRLRGKAQEGERAELVRIFGVRRWQDVATIIKAMGEKNIMIDLDGCITDGKQYIAPDGTKIFKTIHTRDVLASKQLRANGWNIYVVSADDNVIGEKIANKLGAKFIYSQDKSGITPAYQVAVGDSLIDLPMLEAALSFKFCPSDASISLSDRSIHRLKTSGGSGILDEILHFMKTKKVL